MRTIILLISTFVAQLALAQSPYQKAMNEALTLWKSNKSVEAMAKMERIAAVEKDNWIPRYYQALIATLSSFQTQDIVQKNAFLKIANDLIPGDDKHSNAEWYILKATALTAELTVDPMNNGMRLSPQIIAFYEKAKTLDANNPRAIAGLAIFLIHSKKYMGGSTAQEYKDLQKALSLYDTQHSEIPYYPTWGRDQAEEILKEGQKNSL